MPEHGRLAEAMISDSAVSEEERALAIQDLYHLASQNDTVLYLPNKKP